MSHCNLFLLSHEAFWHKSCIMFILIVFGVTCSFVDPLQSTVLTPLTLTTSFKCQNNIGTRRSHFIFQDFSYATMITIESWRIGSSFASCLYESYWTCHAPHMCSNKFSQVKTAALARITMSCIVGVVTTCSEKKDFSKQISQDTTLFLIISL
jgi:hypothetical protein